MFTVHQSVRQSFGRCLNVRKRQRAGALQDAVAQATSAGASARFWTAVALHRFSARGSAAKLAGMVGRDTPCAPVLLDGCHRTSGGQRTARPTYEPRSGRREAPSESFQVRASLPRRLRFISCIWCISWLFLFFTTFIATAQTPPPVSYFRSFVNDIPNQPLVTVTVSGATNVSCFTIEEDLPSPATPVSISSGGV